MVPPMETGPESAAGVPHRITDNARLLGLAKMKSGGWGRVQTAIQRAFLAYPGRLLTTAETRAMGVSPVTAHPSASV
jgi:hypothetical protein